MTIFPISSNYFDSARADHGRVFSSMVALIQDEIDDTTAEYSTQIRDSILAALRLCEREPFFFNERKRLIFKTQRGKTWYGQEEGIFIASEKAVESVLVGIGDATQTSLLSKSPEALKKQYGLQPPQGEPLFYTYLDQKIGLFPTPKQVESVCVVYACARAGDEQLREDDNPWFIHAFDLIKARAKYELCKNILKDPECAAAAFRDFQEQLQALRFETSRRKNSTNILPMRF
ncbi:phage adaptor protein [Bartonella raoultii]|uniref:phage adaptor protein n=1 Tax=Bartonella raoultii TaxID=1457020 RepID=UPI001ABA0D8F|nr:hypothetical protein [Bartonella raoultii]